MSRREEPHPCMVLHQRSYRETSLLLDVLSSRKGRISAVAKGAKRGGAKRFGHLRAFRVLEMGWSGEGELKTLTHAEPSGAEYLLQGRALLSGFYLNELLLRLVPKDDAHPELFELYLRTVGGLAAGESTEALLRFFEKRLLEIAGYGLDLIHEADTGNPVEPSEYYAIEPERGPISDSTHGELRVSGECLIQLHSGNLQSERTRQEAKQLMRFLIGLHLGGRRLNSRSLFRPIG